MSGPLQKDFALLHNPLMVAIPSSPKHTSGPALKEPSSGPCLEQSRHQTQVEFKANPKAGGKVSKARDLPGRAWVSTPTLHCTAH